MNEGSGLDLISYWGDDTDWLMHLPLHEAQTRVRALLLQEFGTSDIIPAVMFLQLDIAALSYVLSVRAARSEAKDYTIARHMGTFNSATRDLMKSKRQLMKSEKFYKSLIRQVALLIEKEVSNPLEKERILDKLESLDFEQHD